jgi:hypothetical protein
MADWFVLESSGPGKLKALHPNCCLREAAVRLSSCLWSPLDRGQRRLSPQDRTARGIFTQTFGRQIAKTCPWSLIRLSWALVQTAARNHSVDSPQGSCHHTDGHLNLIGRSTLRIDLKTKLNK